MKRVGERIPGQGRRSGPGTASPPEKRVLLFSPDRQRLESLLAGLSALPAMQVERSRGEFAVSGGGLRFRLVVRKKPVPALEELRAGFFNVVVLDLRGGPGTLGRREEEFRRNLAILDAMDEEKDVELRYSFHRVVCLVAGLESRGVDAVIRNLGARGVGGVLRDPDVPGPRRVRPGPDPSRPPFAQALLDELVRMTVPRDPGKLALCAAGGGTTGIYFEMGALKCLADCLPPGTINSLDMYFGISAGAVVSGMIANGFTIDEFLAAVAGEPGGRIPPFSLSLLQVPHLNLGGLAFPFRSIGRRLKTTFQEVLSGSLRSGWEAFFFDYGDLLTAPFQAAGFERMLRTLFAGQRGASNDFRRLRRPLFVGATDQDERRHVLFGEPPHDAVPVSRAIEASISINPFFRSTEIDGRFFCDGAVTRTSDFTEAMRKGATLVFALDPFVPYVSQRPGFAREKGALYNIDQDIRTVSFTRFETTRAWVLRRHPEISLYAFLPSNRLRKLMSVNPMDHRPYLAIWKGAYLSTLQRIEVVKHRLAGDLAVRGLALDTARAEAVAQRLRATAAPSLRDFWPDGVARIERPRRAPKLAPDERLSSADAA